MSNEKEIGEAGREDRPRESTFSKDLKLLLNRHNMESGSNTPDFILASYLLECLKAFESHVRWRERWYGRIDDEGTTVEEPSDE